MQKIILGFALLALSSMSFTALGDDDDSDKKTSVCHKGRTVTINQSGLSGHLGHGDSTGRCEDRKAAVVIMQCQAQAEDIVVVAVSSSSAIAEEDVPVPGPDASCADALAGLLDLPMAISSVTAVGDGVSEYLLTGYVGSP
jgi:hypothetical protein